MALVKSFNLQLTIKKTNFYLTKTKRTHIPKRHIFIVQGYVREQHINLLSQDIINLILFFYARSIISDPINLDLDCCEQDIKNAESKYTAQCSKIFRSQQVTLNTLFAIGLKNNFPLITYLLDAYQRDRMYSNGKSLTIYQWFKDSPYIQRVKTICTQNANFLQSAVETCFRKGLMPRFHWKAMNKIQDDIESIIQYFIGVSQFIQTLMAQTDVDISPFAYEFVIFPNKVISNSKMVMPDLSDSSDYSDIYSEDEVENDNFNRYLQNIEGKLIHNTCTYVSTNMDTNKNISSVLTTTFGKFVAKLNNKYQQNMIHYPKRKRFCTICDRQYLQNGMKDSIIMFEPPNNCNTIPFEHVPEWYFNASKTCIVPSMKYNNGNRGVSFDVACTITADMAYKGQMINISFHSDSYASVRCYLFWNGCYIRIVDPNDLKIIVRTMFDMQYGHNEEYLNSQKFEHDITQFKIVDDFIFDDFYQHVTVNKNPQCF